MVWEDEKPYIIRSLDELRRKCGEVERRLSDHETEAGRMINEEITKMKLALGEMRAKLLALIAVLAFIASIAGNFAKDALANILK